MKRIKSLYGGIKKIPIGVVVPALLAFVFFVLTIFAFLLPYMEEALMDKKREMIYELVSAAHSSMVLFEKKEKSAVFSKDQAQEMAQDYLRGLRYGFGNENAFWMYDANGEMLVHKSREIEGLSLGKIKEPFIGGRAIFSETAEMAEAQGEGFVDFWWGEDDKEVVPVVSYFRLFEPWGWVIGTNISFLDIYVEIDHMVDKVKRTTIIILGVILLLLGYNVWAAVRG